MGTTASEGKMRLVAADLLRSKGYTVKDIAAGSGVPKLSRLELTNGDETLTCAVKTTISGRIRFIREDDGTYKVLDDVDRVLHVHPLSDNSGRIRISMFTRETVRTAFEQNRAALEEEGKGHLPTWLNPEHEEGLRFVGSGFGSDILWSEVVSLSGHLEGAEAQSPSEDINDGSIMERIKAMLSEHMGVRPDQLEIDVRVRL